MTAPPVSRICTSCAIAGVILPPDGSRGRMTRFLLLTATELRHLFVAEGGSAALAGDKLAALVA